MSKLLELILEKIEYDRLIAEGRDPREVLHYKFQNVPSDIIDAVIDIDPTKKKTYSQWLLSRWKDESGVILDNIKNGIIAKLFQHYKNHQDIQIKDCPSVEEGLRQFVPEEDTVLTKSSAPMTYVENLGKEVDSDLANDFDIVYNDGNWLIAVPNTYEAECKLGENMHWCTANHFGNGRSYYDRYLSDYGGKYYVNFDMNSGESAKGKDYPFTRYQFHFESKQFKDKNDDDVTLSDIGITDGALEYYQEQGYDTDDIEDLETRWERYDEQRWQSAYRLNEELTLNIEYDDDYEYREPDENTDFYVFDENDDRDPLIWTSVPNPHLNDIEIVNNDEMCVLKTRLDCEEDEKVIVLMKNGSGWRSWNAYDFDKCMILPEDNGAFGLNGRNFQFVDTQGDYTDNNLNVKYLEKMFINEQITNADKYGRLFIETICDGYENLFAISDEGMALIIRRDIPSNDGECFTVNENGLIEGTFRTYRIYGDDYYEEDENYIDYDLEQILDDGNYLVSSDVIEDGRLREVYNILSRDTRQPLIDVWFERYLGKGCNLYCVEKSNKIAYYTMNGKRIGEWYDTYGAIDESQGIILGIDRENYNAVKTHIINANKESVIADFKEVLTKKGVNNKVIVLDYDGSTKGYDYINEEFCFREIASFKQLFRYDFQNMFFCKMATNGDNVLFDFDTQRIVADNIEGLAPRNEGVHFGSDYIVLIKHGDKRNMFSMKDKRQIIPNDVDTIDSFNSYAEMVTYTLNGRHFVYKFNKGVMLINPNGTDVPVSLDNYGRIVFEGDEYKLRFAPTSDDRVNNTEFVFSSWESVNPFGDYGYPQTDEKPLPQEVANLYNRVVGRQDAVAEQFRKLSKRIDEASKRLRCYEILD